MERKGQLTTVKKIGRVPKKKLIHAADTKITTLLLFYCSNIVDIQVKRVLSTNNKLDHGDCFLALGQTVTGVRDFSPQFFSF